MGVSERLLSLLQADAPDEVGKPASVVLPPTNMSTPPDWAQSLVKALASPVTEAGSYLGGVMGGQVPFHPAEAMQEAVKLGSAFAGPKVGAGTLAAMAAPMAKVGVRLAPEAEQAAAQGIRAYHGSPHDFNQFDASKVGTGEGAQAYGHGLYFAQNEEVAKGYRDALSGNWPKLSKTIGEPSALPPEIKGHMYEVNIKAHPDQFLDWDKPLSGQKIPPALVDRASGALEEHGISTDPNAMTGADLYRGLRHQVDDFGAAHSLREAGIPGIKYLDQGSRGAGTGTSNYVVFNPKIIEILKKYGLAGAIAGPAAAGAGLDTQTPQQ